MPLTHRCGTRVVRLTWRGAKRWSCWRQEIASAWTIESGWSCMMAQHTRHDSLAVATALVLPSNSNRHMALWRHSTTKTLRALPRHLGTWTTWCYEDMVLPRTIILYQIQVHARIVQVCKIKHHKVSKPFITILTLYSWWYFQQIDCMVNVLRLPISSFSCTALDIANRLRRLSDGQ